MAAVTCAAFPHNFAYDMLIKLKFITGDKIDLLSPFNAIQTARRSHIFS